MIIDIVGEREMMTIILFYYTNGAFTAIVVYFLKGSTGEIRIVFL